MRTPKFISPTQVSKFYSDREAYYLDYLSDNRRERGAQTQPMAVGSAFDAFVKSHLYQLLVSKDNPTYEARTLFETQVEEHNWDWAWKHGRFCFEKYKQSGALADLILELESGVGEPRFEIEVKGVVNGVPMLGKPDIYFQNALGNVVIRDWKVNGYCSKSRVSPKKGYIRLRKHNQGGTKSHRDVVLQQFQGMTINIAHPLDKVDPDWAAQLTIYGWLFGEEPGEEFTVGIDQLCCTPSGIDYPFIDVAEHRTRTSHDYQMELLKRITFMWNCIETGHIFDDMPREQSDARCKMLDMPVEDNEDFDIITKAGQRRW